MIPAPRRQRAFTLIEVLVALAILGVVALLAYRATAAMTDSEARLVQESDRWLPLDDEVLGARALPEPLVAVPSSYAGQRLPADAIVPLRASGRNEPFTFTVASPAWLVVVAADPLNRVSIGDPVPTIP